jgi:hypothetical protein
MLAGPQSKDFGFSIEDRALLRSPCEIGVHTIKVPPPLFLCSIPNARNHRYDKLAQRTNDVMNL